MTTIVVMTILTVLGLVIFLYTEEIKKREEDALLSLLLKVEGITVHDIPRAAADSLGQYFDCIFSRKILVRATLLSVVATFSGLLVFRSIATGSVESTIAGFSMNTAVVAVCLIAVNVVITVPSIVVTKHIVARAARAASSFAIAKWALLDCALAYAFVALGIYLSSILVVPALTAFNDNSDNAFEVFRILVSFEHRNAILWPAGVWSLDGVSAAIYASFALIPTFLFVSCMMSAIATYYLMHALHRFSIRLIGRLLFAEKTAVGLILGALLTAVGLMMAWQEY